jgi:hypothetical protein
MIKQALPVFPWTVLAQPSGQAHCTMGKGVEAISWYGLCGRLNARLPEAA